MTTKSAFDLQAYFRDCQSLIESALENSLPKKEVYPPKIHEAMRYSLMAGGKRIRPILCLAGSEACGGGRRAVLPVACALEMIHTFSLIHDDLPAMDDDNLRRGLPTNHKVFGEAIAILAGDGLVAQAFVVLGQMGNTCDNPQKLLEVIRDIALATGSVGMVGGQVVDMESAGSTTHGSTPQGKKIDLKTLQQLHRLKTGCLITASVVSGAKLATSSVEKIISLERYGESIGLAFQIADDILDIEGGAEIGKDIGSDVDNNKSTYPALLGLDGAKQAAQNCKNEALGALRDFGPEADPLRAIAEYIVDRKK